MNNARDRAMHQFAARFGDLTSARSWFVPGRIEVFGKHVDYAGGRSLLAAIDRGFHIVARPRSDRRVHIVDARSRQALAGSIDATLAQQPGTWYDYPTTVLRRIGRDFPAAATGMDAVILSTLPSASGLSSSSALVIATFLPLAAFNSLEADQRFVQHCASPATLADYLGAVENGRAHGPFLADFGVGTHGGSQDHSAITCCTAGHLAQVRFRPTVLERQVRFPDDWRLVVAASGVPAAKGGAVQAHYNNLAAQARDLLVRWNDSRGDDATSLLQLLETVPDVADRLAELIPDEPHLVRRLAQFREETTELIPAAVSALEAGDIAGFGTAVNRSAELGDAILDNQVGPTRHLAASARALGSYGAAGFGAGFGGSVYAVVRRQDATAFRDAWRNDYRSHHPEHAERSEFFVAAPGEGSREVDPG